MLISLKIMIMTLIITIIRILMSSPVMPVIIGMIMIMEIMLINVV